MDEKTSAALIDTLQHERDKALRIAAAEVLRHHNALPAVVDALLYALKTDKNWEIRHTCLLSLGTVGGDAVLSTIIAVLQNDCEFMVRSTAAAVLGWRIDKAPLDPLIHALKYDKSPYVRRSAALALGQTRQQQAVPPLIAALKDCEKDMRGLRVCAAVYEALAGMPFDEAQTAAQRWKEAEDLWHD